MFCIAVLNQLYWVTGSVIGNVAGSLIKFNSTGIDFAMTALFIVIFIEQWERHREPHTRTSGSFRDVVVSDRVWTGLVHHCIYGWDIPGVSRVCTGE